MGSKKVSGASGIGLGPRIKKLRLENKWSQAELARLAGTSQGGVNLIEAAGRDDIRASTVIKFASAFHVTTDEILGYDVNAIPAQPSAAERQRLDAVERGLVDLSGMVQRGFEEIASRLPTASQKKPSQRKRS